MGFAELKLRLLGWFKTLQPRERIIVGVAATLVAAAIVLLGIARYLRATVQSDRRSSGTG
jgi:hypothetical protein